MKLEPLKPFICAIDPGTHSGIALWRRRDEKIYFSAGHYNFYSVQLFLVRSFPDNRNRPGTDGVNHKETLKIFVERPARIVYGRNSPLPIEQREDLISKCGGNRREGELLALCLTARGFDVQLLPPINEPKWNYEQCARMTGNKKRTNEHERDSIRMAIYKANWRPKLR